MGSAFRLPGSDRRCSRSETARVTAGMLEQVLATDLAGLASDADTGDSGNNESPMVWARDGRFAAGVPVLRLNFAPAGAESLEPDFFGNTMASSSSAFASLLSVLLASASFFLNLRSAIIRTRATSICSKTAASSSGWPRPSWLARQ